MAEIGGSSDKTFKVMVTGEGVHIERDVEPDIALHVFALITGGTRADPDPSGTAGPSAPSEQGGQPQTKRRTTAQTRDDESKPKRRRRPSGPGVVKDLSLRPSGKTPFATFAAQKNPSSHAEKQTAIVYWLQHEAGVAEGIGAAHINTCYQEVGWPRPKDLVASLYLTASKKGWMDTSDIANIALTTRGEDYVRHFLPRKPAEQK